MNKDINVGHDVDAFVRKINTKKLQAKGRIYEKSIFKERLLAFEYDENALIAEFARFGGFMLENGTRKKENPAISTMFTYISLIKAISLLLENRTLASLNEFELCSLFEQVLEIKGDNKKTISELLNLFTFLNETFGKSLGMLELVISSTENVDKNLIWDWEVELILQSNELSALDKLFVQTVYEAGSRITEAYQLIGEDIDTVGELLHFRTNRLGAMKNRYSTRYIPFSDLTDSLVVSLLSNTQKMKEAIFDFDELKKEQISFNNFCMNINATIKKELSRNVSLKHLRHSRARIKFIDNKDNFSLRNFFQAAGRMGHNNLQTSQKHYIHSAFEENSLIEVNDDDAASLMNITSANLRTLRSRFRIANENNTMNNKTLNALLFIKHAKKKTSSCYVNKVG
ncbi:tyrosine-type recombinase/integrase [Colwellia sp. BRX8-9]|uniref:tyrosine-type recombinase/integrase n=1 Tax=Colwellia sp. BRX8-9 TaxID=2759831 RepID=UPI0015F6C923|nr:tyrosine-type recombinase/integrase [Colwellia sp. BRX8-9]MBA6349861.1 tyrosine-type recombinase/integrase [Colwellia sp. BRX8-9]